MLIRTTQRVHLMRGIGSTVSPEDCSNAEESEVIPSTFGPFEILQQIGSLAYKLDLPPSATIHPVFHMSCLKLKLGEHVTVLPALPPMDCHGELKPKPKVVLSHRMIKRKDRAVTEVQGCLEGR